jgi:Cu/Ag efflux protein CusF
MSAALALALAGAPAFAMSSGHKMDHPTTEPAGAMEHADNCGMPMGEGEITALDVAKAKVKISHKPITSIGWSAMTMEFGVLKSVDLAAFGAGDKVHFLLVPQKDKSYRIAAICALDAENGAHDACMNSMHKLAMKIAAASGKSCDMKMDGTDHEKMEGMDHNGHSMIDRESIVLAHGGESNDDHCKDHKDHGGESDDGHDHDGNGEADDKDHDDGHDCEDEGENGERRA